MAEDGQLFKSVNPLFFKYTPSNGQFSGQNCYGYVSFEKFIDAATQINNKTAIPSDFDMVCWAFFINYKHSLILFDRPFQLWVPLC